MKLSASSSGFFFTEPDVTLLTYKPHLPNSAIHPCTPQTTCLHRLPPTNHMVPPALSPGLSLAEANIALLTLKTCFAFYAVGCHRSRTEGDIYADNVVMLQIKCKL